MRKTFALALFGLTILAPIFVVPAAAQSVAPDQTVVFAVENMTCALCPVTVKRAMEGVAGVRSVQIDLQAHTATVQFDATSTTPDAIGFASTNAGYPAMVGG